MDKLTYIADVGGPLRDSGARVAAELGYLAEAGLQVRILASASDAATLAALAGGRADLGVVDYAEILLRAGSSTVGSVRCVAAIQPCTLLALTAPPGRVAHPADLAGARLAAAGTVHRRLFPAYARLAGIDASRTVWRKAPAGQLPTLLAAGTVDGIGEYLGRSVLSAADRVVVLPYGEVLSDLFGDVLVTTTAMLTGRRGLVRRFTQALLRGVRQAVDSPNEAGRILRTARPDVPAADTAAELALMHPFTDSRPPAQGMGRLDLGRVSRGIALMQATGIYHRPVTAEQVVDPDVVTR
jgi:NitT/TauT family transport system substrate-binding protein